MTSAEITRERVLGMVAQDLRPVRPLLPPAARVGLLVPVAAAAALLAATQYGLRADLARLGPLVAWGLSAAQWAFGLAVLGVALREAIPGDGLSRRALGWLVVGAALATLTITATTYRVHPTFVSPLHAWRVSYLCLRGGLEYGVPIVLIATLLAARAVPTRPALVGALCGLAAGLFSDSGWRLTCWITAPAHVLGAHTLAVVVLVFLGGTLSTAIDRMRS